MFSSFYGVWKPGNNLHLENIFQGFRENVLQIFFISFFIWAKANLITRQRQISLSKMDRNQDQNAIVGVVASVLAFGLSGLKIKN
ncbi:hypothetical protein V6Z11_A01G078100 [Gossypium hirsutum]